MLSHEVSTTVDGDREEVDPWIGMRETRRADGEPTNAGVGELLNGGWGGR